MVDAEGAYFFNKYVGVGGRLRIRAQSVKDFGDFANYVAVEDYYAWQGLQPHYEAAYPGDYRGTSAENERTFLNKVGYRTESESAWNDNAPVTDSYGIVKSDHITEFTGSVGLYFNLPLGTHFSLGTKALIGRSIKQGLNQTREKLSADFRLLKTAFIMRTLHKERKEPPSRRLFC